MSYRYNGPQYPVKEGARISGNPIAQMMDTGLSDCKATDIPNRRESTLGPPICNATEVNTFDTPDDDLYDPSQPLEDKNELFSERKGDFSIAYRKKMKNLHHRSANYLKQLQRKDSNTLTYREIVLKAKHEYIVKKYEIYDKMYNKVLLNARNQSKHNRTTSNGSSNSKISQVQQANESRNLASNSQAQCQNSFSVKICDIDQREVHVIDYHHNQLSKSQAQFSLNRFPEDQMGNESRNLSSLTNSQAQFDNSTIAKIDDIDDREFNKFDQYNNQFSKSQAQFLLNRLAKDQQTTTITNNNSYIRETNATKPRHHIGSSSSVNQYTQINDPTGGNFIAVPRNLIDDNAKEIRKFNWHKNETYNHDYPNVNRSDVPDFELPNNHHPRSMLSNNDFCTRNTNANQAAELVHNSWYENPSSNNSNLAKSSKLKTFSNEFKKNFELHDTAIPYNQVNIINSSIATATELRNLACSDMPTPTSRLKALAKKLAKNISPIRNNCQAVESTKKEINISDSANCYSTEVRNLVPSINHSSSNSRHSTVHHPYEARNLSWEESQNLISVSCHSNQNNSEDEIIVLSDDEITEELPPPPPSFWIDSNRTLTEDSDQAKFKLKCGYQRSLRFLRMLKKSDTLTAREKKLRRKHEFHVRKYERYYLDSNTKTKEEIPIKDECSSLATAAPKSTKCLSSFKDVSNESNDLNTTEIPNISSYGSNSPCNFSSSHSHPIKSNIILCSDENESEELPPFPPAFRNFVSNSCDSLISSTNDPNSLSHRAKSPDRRKSNNIAHELNNYTYNRTQSITVLSNEMDIEQETPPTPPAIGNEDSKSCDDETKIKIPYRKMRKNYRNSVRFIRKLAQRDPDSLTDLERKHKRSHLNIIQKFEIYKLTNP